MEPFLTGFFSGIAAGLWALIAVLGRDGRQRQAAEEQLIADLDRLQTRLRTADEERKAA
jgi:hypothetical protein